MSCGGGMQYRSRSCDGPYHGGLECEGWDIDGQECNTHECPGQCHRYKGQGYVRYAV